MKAAIEELIWDRANRACENCHLRADRHPAPFQIDHIVAHKHHADDEVENLALACLRCNSYKGPNIAGIDSDSGQVTALFNPRKDIGTEHFELDGPILKGLTATARATIDVLNINDDDAVRVREALIDEGRFDG